MASTPHHKRRREGAAGLESVGTVPSAVPSLLPPTGAPTASQTAFLRSQRTVKDFVRCARPRIRSQTREQHSEGRPTRMMQCALQSPQDLLPAVRPDSGRLFGGLGGPGVGGDDHLPNWWGAWALQCIGSVSSAAARDQSLFALCLSQTRRTKRIRSSSATPPARMRRKRASPRL